MRAKCVLARIPTLDLFTNGSDMQKPTDDNPNVLSQKQLMKLMGYSRPGDVEKRLIEQGIRPIYGRPGHFFVTLGMLSGEQKSPAPVDLI